VSLKLLHEADYVLNACGRPVPPPGYKCVDLPRTISFHSAAFQNAAPSSPVQVRISNNATVPFICKGVAVNLTPVAIRVKWPSGRFLSQNPYFPADTPKGSAGNMTMLEAEEVIMPDAKFGVEMSGFNAGVVNVTFWGVLRYFILDDGGSYLSGSKVGCIVGYPSNAGRSSDASKLTMIPDPIEALEYVPRYVCGPNQNIMCPEWMLGLDYDETPSGYRDESYTFFSPPITCAVGSQNYGTQVIVPGQGDVILKQFTSTVVFDPGVTTTPNVSVRFPNGYSLTGGDLIPSPINDFGTNGPFFVVPVFPTIKLPYGDRLIIDVADQNGVGVGNFTITLQFYGVKRYKL
jgi:hypothetical protein